MFFYCVKSTHLFPTVNCYRDVDGELNLFFSVPSLPMTSSNFSAAASSTSSRIKIIPERVVQFSTSSKIEGVPFVWVLVPTSFLYIQDRIRICSIHLGFQSNFILDLQKFELARLSI